jgi:predicted double-glycine peptidase
MAEHLITDEQVQVTDKPDGELRQYISTFLKSWHDRQERVTQNRAAKEKAKREWEAEQDRLRHEARSKNSLHRSLD